MAVAFRFYVGLSVPEIRGLQWKNLGKIKFIDSGRLLVMRTVKGNSPPEPYAMSDTKLRYIPLSPRFYELLCAYRDYVIKLCGKDIAELPIVPNSLDQRGEIISYERIKYATKSVIGRIGIPEDNVYFTTSAEDEEALETDANAYHGELFRSNFIYRMLNTCGMSDGECSYLMGKKPADTFSQSYCDYGEETSQAILVTKLSRWDMLFRRAKPETYAKREELSDEEEMILRAADRGNRLTTELCIEGSEGAAQLELYSDTGMDVQIIAGEA